MRKCEKCVHYDLYKMITEGAYSYSGRIFCFDCSEYQTLHNYFELSEPESGKQYTPIVSLCPSCGQPLPCKPKVKLEKLDYGVLKDKTEIGEKIMIIEKINELTDAVNELREEKA